MKSRRMLFFAIALLCACVLCTTALAEDVGITITAPSDAETTIASGRSFYVLGTFENGAELNDGDRVRVELVDASGAVVRSVSTVIKDNRSMYIDYPGLSYYGSDKTVLLSAGMPDLIWDGKNEASFHEGDLKLYYNDTEFAALIPGGTGVFSDGMKLVDSAGRPYAGLAKGNYTIRVTVTDNTDPKQDETDATGTAEKAMTIGINNDKILSRFSPAGHKARLTEFAKENGCRIYNDLFPGYWSKGDLFCEITSAWRAADATEYLQGKAHFIIYNVKGTSTTYSLECPTLQLTNSVDDESRLQCYYYEYGEPTLPDAAKTVSEIVPFAQGDKLQLVRAETTVKETADYVYTQDTPTAGAYDLDLTDGVSANVGETVSLYGVTALIQVDASDIADSGSNAFKLNNKISTLRYTIKADGVEQKFDKDVTLNRTSGGWNNYSELEFKHDIPITADMTGKTLDVCVVGYDAHGNLVAGASERFSITVSDTAVSGAVSAAAPLVPQTGDAGVNYWAFAAIALALAAAWAVTIHCGRKSAK